MTAVFLFYNIIFILHCHILENMHIRIDFIFYGSRTEFFASQRRNYIKLRMTCVGFRNFPTQKIFNRLECVNFEAIFRNTESHLTNSATVRVVKNKTLLQNYNSKITFQQFFTHHFLCVKCKQTSVYYIVFTGFLIVTQIIIIFLFLLRAISIF